MDKSKENKRLKGKLERRDKKIKSLQEKNRQLEAKVRQLEAGDKKKEVTRKVVLSDEQEQLLSELLADIGLTT